MQNTFQGIIITDFSRSFAVFTYRCGDLELFHFNLRFHYKAGIGFTTDDGLSALHPLALTDDSDSIDCLNSPASDWVNIVYEISAPGKNIVTQINIVSRYYNIMHNTL